jgi:hypothetical protein
MPVKLTSLTAMLLSDADDKTKIDFLVTVCGTEKANTILIMVLKNIARYFSETNIIQQLIQEIDKPIASDSDSDSEQALSDSFKQILDILSQQFMIQPAILSSEEVLAATSSQQADPKIFEALFNQNIADLKSFFYREIQAQIAATETTEAVSAFSPSRVIVSSHRFPDQVSNSGSYAVDPSLAQNEEPRSRSSSFNAQMDIVGYSSGSFTKALCRISDKNKRILIFVLLVVLYIAALFVTNQFVPEGKGGGYLGFKI